MKRIHLILIVVALISVQCTTKSESFRDEKGNFSIKFPTEPKKETHSLNLSFGRFSGTRYIINKPDDWNQSYSVIYVDLPEKTIHSDSLRLLNEFFVYTQTDYLQSLGENNLTKVLIINVKGFPGREFIWKNPKTRLISTRQVYLVKNRLYMIEVMYKPGKQFNVKMDQFFKSFKLLDKSKNPHPEKEPEKPEKKFKIEWPGETTIKDQIVNGMFGDQAMKIEMYQHDNSNSPDEYHNTAYGVVYTCLPKDSVADYTDQKRYEYLQLVLDSSPLIQNGGSQIQHHKTTFRGCVCIESQGLILEGKMGTRLKTFMKGNYLYQLQVVSEPGYQDNSRISEFFESFEFK